jgi:hypothetical protein
MDKCAQRTGTRERLTVFLASLAAVLACGSIFVTCGCATVPPISGTVTDTITGEPIPGALVQVIYSVSTMTPVDRVGRIFSKVAQGTDSNGKFAFPSKTIMLLNPFTRFDWVRVEALHPFYVYWGGGATPGAVWGLSKPKITNERCRNLTLRLRPLEDYLATHPKNFEIAFWCEEYFVQRELLHLPIDVEQTISHWQELGETFPQAREGIRWAIEHLQGRMRKYRTPFHDGKNLEE